MKKIRPEQIFPVLFSLGLIGVLIVWGTFSPLTVSTILLTVGTYCFIRFWIWFHRCHVTKSWDASFFFTYEKTVDDEYAIINAFACFIPASILFLSLIIGYENHFCERGGCDEAYWLSVWIAENMPEVFLSLRKAIFRI